MEWLKKMSLKKSFFIIIAGNLFAAILLGLLCSGLCQAAIDCFHLSVTVAVPISTEAHTAPEGLELHITEGGDTQLYYTYRIDPWYTVLSFLQIFLPAAFVILALLYADIIFYRLKLQHPLQVLQDSAKRIQMQDLDFTITHDAKDEFGELCAAFETMRQTLLANNRELWRHAEERKRLNAAFSHDLRNPAAVLKGAAKLLQKEIETETPSPENLKESAALICQYTGRIEQYVEKMTKAQKLEELPCCRQTFACSSLQAELQTSLSILAEASGRELKLSFACSAETVQIDKQFVYNTAENLTTNALRHADKVVSVTISCREHNLTLHVANDGQGFPDAVLQRGITPFFRGSDTEDGHFGMGLYICKLLCEKHGGSLTLENLGCGASVTAIFCF